MIIEEKKIIEAIEKCNSALLIEPSYIRKYIPLGLAKIAGALRNKNKSFSFRRSVPSMKTNFDVIFMTSLFTYNMKEVEHEIERALQIYPETPIYLGGIAATLLKKQFNQSYPMINIFPGYSKYLETAPTDYLTNWYIKGKWQDFSFVFTTRGCPNSCGYCAVKRLEPELWINPEWKIHIDQSKKYVMVSDNNLSSFPIDHIRDVFEFLHDKKIILDNGFDVKKITDDIAAIVGKNRFETSGFRIAFDRIEEDGIFQNAVKKLFEHGIKPDAIMAYILFNFNDTPAGAVYRIEECKKLGIRPYPQQYIPLSKSDEKSESKFIGKHWTKHLCNSFRRWSLFAGNYKKYTFEEFIRRFEEHITAEDFEVWRESKKNIA